MAERAQNLQDTFLNYVRKNKTPLTIFLVNGVKLQGIVTWFDNFCVLLRRDGHSQLVYKHAISTIMPGAPLAALRAERRERRRPGGRLSELLDEVHAAESANGRRRQPGRGARALVLVPVPQDAPQAAARPRRGGPASRRRSGLARAIDLDVAGGDRRAARQSQAGDPVRLRQGRGNRRARGRARRSAWSSSMTGCRRCSSATSRTRLEGQGHRPHRPDPRDLRRARADARRARCRSNSPISTTRRAGWCARWTHLERQRGGFGFLGGPGETQIEADRRVIDERIAAHRDATSKTWSRAAGCSARRRKKRGPRRWSPWSATPTPASRRCSTR